MISMTILFWFSLIFGIIFTIKLILDSLTLGEIIIWLTAIVGLVVSCYFKYDKPKEKENATPTVTVEVIETVKTE